MCCSHLESLQDPGKNKFPKNVKFPSLGSSSYFFVETKVLKIGGVCEAVNPSASFFQLRFIGYIFCC